MFNGGAMDEDKPNSVKKDIIWYLGLVLSIILIVVYWNNYVAFSASTFEKDFSPLLPKLASAIIILFICRIFIRFSLPIIKTTISFYFRSEEWKVIRMLYIYFVWAIALLIIITGAFGSLSSLGISLSLIGAGVAFALQQVILSFAAWFLIIIKRPYKIGDRIYIKKNEVLGDVEDITMLFTVIKEVAPNDTVTGKNIILPNSTVFLEPITNYSYDVPHIWISIPISVTYESDLELAEKIIFNVAKKEVGMEMAAAVRLIREKTPESVQLEFAIEDPVIRVEFADSSITIRVRVMCLPKHVPAIRSEIYRKVFQEFNKPENKDKVEIAYPHMELVFHDKIMREVMKTYIDMHPPE